ncbi:MAG: hypothetical protein AABX17_04170 [Nanoarchaeota archaeon]
MVKRVSSPRFLRRVKIHGTWDAQKRRIIRSMNTSIFYSNLYQSLFGGDVCRPHKGNAEEIFFCVERNFHPDMIKIEKEQKTYTEIKTTTKRNFRPPCPYRQVENYAFNVLRELEKYKRITSLDYAFFTYIPGERSMDVLTNPKLEKHLAENTAGLLILPANLLFLVLSGANKKVMDQTSNKGPDVALYFRPSGAVMSSLQQGNGAVEKLASHSSIEEFVPSLMLEGLAYEKRKSPISLYSHDNKVVPFPITRYFNTDEHAWAASFKKNHSALLTKMLRVRDLHNEARQERDNLPF